jgi:hypothetical protein
MGQFGLGQAPDKPKLKDIDFYVGAGLPELFHFGIRANTNNWHFNASYGMITNNEAAGHWNLAYHFGSKLKTDDYPIKPWFAGLGATYHKYETSIVRGEDIYINPRIGRDLRITNSLKFCISSGVGINVYHYKIKKKTSPLSFDIHFPVIPSGQVSFCLQVFRNKKLKDVEAE